MGKKVSCSRLAPREAAVKKWDQDCSSALVEGLQMGFCFLVFRVFLCRTFMMFGAMCLLLSTDPLALHSGQKTMKKCLNEGGNPSLINVKMCLKGT